MRLNSRLLFTIIIFFIVVNILDVVTAMFILPGESNPIYLLTQSVATLWILKFVIISAVLWVYFNNKYPSKFWLFSYIYTLIIGSLLISFGVVSNIVGILNPTIIQSATALSTTVKIKYYANIVSILMLIPYVISMAAFKAYEYVEPLITYKIKK